ncbi:helix-turn-helix transcriptional regulator [Verrucosispora sp. WMMA2044]|uniref:helix-turn-helix domain-containing protein n=1 Tax=Verrucosispora sp. WMMA2044 TaxID=3016419 RepID=UPI00248B31BB|nr:helix-turn-helix transcriptional regulator [Verrucosispora sp. WMMA2044]WBB48428.1 helix-turn-helix transcriptional regulator [Verrucosispora sp. WMMA2044]
MIDPQRIAEAKRALGSRLAARRHARGLTQLELARRVPVSRTTIAGVESGRQCPDRVFWQRCEAALGAGGELLAGYDEYRGLRQQLDHEKAEAAQRARWGEVEARPPSAGVAEVSMVAAGRPLRETATEGSAVRVPSGLPAAPSEVADVVVAGEEDWRDGDAVTLAIVSDGQAKSWRVSRRAVLELAAGLATLPAMTASGMRAVDPAVVEHFAELRALLVQADDRLGGLTILSTVEQQIALIAALRRQARGSLRDRLLSTEARWSEFAGWLSDDLGDRAAGDRWLDRAGSMAQEAEDQEFSAYVLARKAQRMMGTGDEDRVVGLARAASRLPDVPALVQAFAAVQEGHGSAIEQKASTFQAAIERAHKLVAAASPAAGDTSALGSFCTRPYLAAQEGEGWLRLNQPWRAVDSFTAAVNEWPDRYRRERGVYLSRIAHAYLAASQPDQAATVAAEALSVATTTGSARVRRNVTTLARHLEPFSRQPDVRQFLDQLATTG